jgi:hypothetical protein
MRATRTHAPEHTSMLSCMGRCVSCSSRSGTHLLLRYDLFHAALRVLMCSSSGRSAARPPPFSLLCTKAVLLGFSFSSFVVACVRVCMCVHRNLDRVRWRACMPPDTGLMIIGRTLFLLHLLPALTRSSPPALSTQLSATSPTPMYDTRRH